MKSKLSIPRFIMALVFSVALTTPATACTDFLIKTTDGNYIVGRSMEWGADLNSQIQVYSKGAKRFSHAPDGKISITWTSKYGYLGLNSHKMDLVLDGMNEKGLSVGLLWLPGTTYQTVTTNAISLIDVGHWILGNFTTVEEAKSAISKIQIWAPQMADWGGVPTAHLALHDAQGKSAVIEFIDGKQKIYDNPTGVLTNAPSFDWHITNLRNYIRLSAGNPEPITVGGTVLSPPGQGSGFLGIPGDWTPPSRFVRTTAMLAFAKPANNSTEGVNLAEHILNAVDIPLGDVRQAANDLQHSDYTQWIVIKDLTNSIFYFRSYDNLTLRTIDLKKLSFDVDAKTQPVPISGGTPAIDITSALK